MKMYAYIIYVSISIAVHTAYISYNNICVHDDFWNFTSAYAQ